MGISTEQPRVSQEEVARRIAEHRQMSYARRAPAVIVYSVEHHPCPWPDCDYRLAGGDFKLEELEDVQVAEQLMRAWWIGPGLVGRCPGCGRYVLFGFGEKYPVGDPAIHQEAMLPDDWAWHGTFTPPTPTAPKERAQDLHAARAVR